jgi:hypothetical protein
VNAPPSGSVNAPVRDAERGQRAPANTSNVLPPPDRGDGSRAANTGSNVPGPAPERGRRIPAAAANTGVPPAGDARSGKDSDETGQRGPGFGGGSSGGGRGGTGEE